MARITTTTDHIELDGDYGGSIDSVRVTCDRCLHSEEVHGQGEGSLKRAAYLLRENCPRGEKNFYVVEED